MSPGLRGEIARFTVGPVQGAAYEVPGRGFVCFNGSLPGGFTHTPDNPYIAITAAQLLDQGTRRRDKRTIARQLDEMGAALNFGVDSQFVRFSGQCLCPDLPRVLALLGEQLREPAFTPEEFERCRQRSVARERQGLDDPRIRAGAAFARALYPRGHPNFRFEPAEAARAAGEVTRDGVEAFHARAYGPAGLRVTAAGEISAAVFAAALEAALSGWTGGLAPVVPAAGWVERADYQEVRLSEKPSIAVRLGQRTGLHERDPDRLALSLGLAVLGGGFTGRLMSEVRVKQGLTYGIGAGLQNDSTQDGHWAIETAFTPALLARGLAATEQVLLRWHEDGVTEEETALRKTNFIGSFAVALSSAANLSGRLLSLLEGGLPATWLQDFPSRVEALTADAVTAAIRRYVRPLERLTVCAGSLPAR